MGTILLLAWLLLRQRRQIGLPAALFPTPAVCVAGFVIGNTPTVSLRPAALQGISGTVSGFTVVFLWRSCLACFDSRFNLEGGVLWVGVAWAAIAAADRSLLGAAIADRELSLLQLLGGDYTNFRY